MRNAAADELRRMPFEITYQRDYALIRLFGAVTGDELLEAARALQAVEAQRGAVNRVTDLTGMEELNFGYLDVDALAQVRRSLSFQSRIRSAIVANRPIQVGYARMFQTLNDNPAIEVRIVACIDEAVAWFLPAR